MTVAKKARIEASPPLPPVQSLITAFTTHGLVPEQVGDRWFGGLRQASPEEVLKKCTLLIQNVLTQLNAVVGIDPLKPEATYTFSDFKDVEKRVCQVYKDYVKLRLQECLSTDVKLLQLQTSPLEFPLGLKPHPSSPVAKLAGFVDFVVAAKALFSNENKEMAIELTLQLWEQISDAQHTHHLIRKAFHSLQEVFQDPRLPTLKVESYMKTAFDQGKIALNKIARMDPKRDVMEADCRDLTSSFFKWKIHPRGKDDSPRWVTPRLLDECESSGKAGFFIEDDAQKLMIGAFHQAWAQDFGRFKPNWVILKQIGNRWDIWSKLTLKPVQKGLETFLLNFDQGKFVLSGVDCWILKEVSPYFRLLFSNQYIEGLANEASLQEVSEAEFHLFYDAILRDPQSPLPVVTVPAPSAALDERLVVLRLAQRFQCLPLSETYFKSLKIENAKIDDLFEFEEKLVKQECLDPTTATYWAPIRAAYLETELMPKFTLVQAVDFLNHNFNIAKHLNIPAFLLKTLIVNCGSVMENPSRFSKTWTKELPDSDANILRSSIELYSNSLETLIFENLSPPLPLLKGLKADQLKTLTLGNLRNRDNIEEICSSVVKFSQLNTLSIRNYGDLSKCVQLINKLPHLTKLTIQEVEFEETFLESLRSLPKKINLTIKINEPDEDEGAFLFSSLDFWKVFLNFDHVRIEFSDVVFSEKLHAHFEAVSYNKASKDLIFEKLKVKNDVQFNFFILQIKAHTAIFFNCEI